MLLPKTLRGSLIGTLALLTGSLLSAQVQARSVELMYFGARDDMAFLGVGQGLEDAGDATGVDFRLKVESVENFRPLNNPRPAAIFTTAGKESIRLLSHFNPDIPIFSLAEEDTDFRAHCLPNVFHIIPSEKMRLDALSQWRDSGQEGFPRAVAWHEEFEPGKKLSQNFIEKRTVTMSEQAWAGWVAAGIVARLYESFAVEDPQKVLDFLHHQMMFDGRKGMPLSFRPNGQLRQPMLLVLKDRVIGTAPVEGVTRKTDLDSLGYSDCPAPADKPEDYLPFPVKTMKPQ